MIPDHYVSHPRHFAIPRTRRPRQWICGFKERLEDRFGPLPQKRRTSSKPFDSGGWPSTWGWKIMLKGGKMIAAFIADEDSPFFQGPTFARILNHLKHHARDTDVPAQQRPAHEHRKHHQPPRRFARPRGHRRIACRRACSDYTRLKPLPMGRSPLPILR